MKKQSNFIYTFEAFNIKRRTRRGLSDRL